MEDDSDQPIQTEKAREVNFREMKPSKSKPNLVLIFVGILVLAAIALVIYLFLNSNKNSSKSVSEKTKSKQASSSAQIAQGSCTGKESLVDTKQGYESCFPKGWIQVQLKPSGLEIGLDPKQADATFPGTITIDISDNLEASEIQNISDNTSKFAFGPVRVDGIKGTQVTYTRLQSDPLVNYPSAITSVVANFGRTYTITLNSTADSFATNETIYNDFLSDFKFIKGTPNPPWSDSRNILVDTPWIGDSIQTPVVVSGEAIAFEGTVSIRVKDGAGHVLAQTTTQTTTGQKQSPFKTSVDFGKPTTKKGTVEVYTVSARDGSDQDLVSIPVVFP